MGILGGIAEQAAGAGLGMLLGSNDDKKQIRQQEKLQAMQIKGQKELTEFNRKQQMQMWEDTNYDAQRKQMEKAGLNVGLMYGGGGAGGATSNVSTGSVSGASATGRKAGAAQEGMSMMLQNQNMEAQRDLIKAQTEKTKAETAKTTGADTAQTESSTAVNVQTLENLKQNVKNAEASEVLTRMQSRLTDVQATVAEETTDDAITTIAWNAQKAIGEARSASAKGNVDTKTMDEAVSIVKSTAINAILDSALKEGQLSEIKARIENLKEQVRLGDAKNAIETFKAEIEKDYPGLMNVAGRTIDQIVRGIQKITGANQDLLTRRIQK